MDAQRRQRPAPGRSGQAVDMTLAARHARAAAAALFASLLAYYAFADELPEVGKWFNVAVVAIALVPAVFALVLLALPLRTARGRAGTAVAFAALALACDAGGFDVAANFSKLAAATAFAFVFLDLFENVSWVVLVAAVIPAVDAISVWRGPTRHIVTERPGVFDALSFAFPVPGTGAFQLGLPDLLFFALFLAAAHRWELRVLATWLAMVVSFGVTMALTVGADPFGIGGLPALPLLSVAFLAANADVLVRRWRRPEARTSETS
jgi:hypothetical protein